MNQRQKALQYMKRHLAEHIDPRTNELDYTRLAENTSAEFDIYEDDDYTIPDWVWDMSASLGGNDVCLDCGKSKSIPSSMCASPHAEGNIIF